MVLNDHVTLDGLMFDIFFFSPFAFTVESVRAKASLCPRIFDANVMCVLFKEDIFDFIGLGHTNNWILLCELY